MEEKSTEWVMTLLAFRNEQVPILDTVMIKDNKIFKILYNDMREMIVEKDPKPIAALLQSLINLRISPSAIICCFIKGPRRKFLTKHELKLILSKKLPLLNQIQICTHVNNLQASPTYILDLYLTQYHYISKIFAKTANSNQKIKNAFLSNYAKEIAQIIIKSIEIEENKRVLKLEIEFVKDSYGKLYLHQINQCKTVQVNRLTNYVISTLTDLNYFMTQCKEVKSRLIFEKQSSTETDPNYSKISINSEDSEEDSKIDTKFTSKFSISSSRKDSFERNNHRIPSNKTDPSEFSRRSNRKSGVFISTSVFKHNPKDDDFNNSIDYGSSNIQFLELLSRHMIKYDQKMRRPISPSHEEVKKQIRIVYDSICLTPVAEKLYNYNSSALPLIKVSPDPFNLIDPQPRHIPQAQSLPALPMPKELHKLPRANLHIKAVTQSVLSKPRLNSKPTMN